MDERTFNSIVNEMTDRRMKVLASDEKKRTAGGTDRLTQLKEQARLRRRPSAMSAAIDLMTKHYIDLCDMADQRHPLYHETTHWISLVIDMHNYLDLIYACALDDIDKEQEMEE